MALRLLSCRKDSHSTETASSRRTRQTWLSHLRCEFMEQNRIISMDGVMVYFLEAEIELTLQLLSVSLYIFSGLGPCPAVLVPGIGPRTPAFSPARAWLDPRVPVFVICMKASWNISSPPLASALRPGCASDGLGVRECWTAFCHVHV